MTNLQTVRALKTILSILSIFSFFTLIFLDESRAQSIPECTTATTLSTLLPNNECTLTPNTVQVSVYQFGVCTSAPSISDISNCDFFLNSLTPTTLNLGLNTTGDLNGATTDQITSKNYTHAVMIISNSVKLSTVFEFANAQQGYDGGTGTSCWTNGQTGGFLTVAASDNSITCGSVPNAVLTEYSYPYFGSTGTYTATATVGSKTNLYSLIQTTLPSTMASTDSNGTFIAVSQTMAAALDLTGLTQTQVNALTFDVSFMVTNAAKLTFYQDSNPGDYCATGSTPCVGNIEVNFIDVVVSAS